MEVIKTQSKRIIRKKSRYSENMIESVKVSLGMTVQFNECIQCICNMSSYVHISLLTIPLQADSATLEFA